MAVIAGGLAYLATRGGGTEKAAAVTIPYDRASPWNTHVPVDAPIHPLSTDYVASIPAQLTSDPDQYTFPVYEVPSSLAPTDITVTRTFSNVTGPGPRDIDIADPGSTIQVPIPANALPAAGHDAQLIVWNRETGDEWGFFRFERGSDGSLTAENGYHYNTNWSGVAPEGFGSRGPGIPYLAGLIRPDEIRAGVIEHALAFAYDSPSAAYISPPATKSDGTGGANTLPEGARLRLNPALTDEDFDSWGLSSVGKIIARAMQRYGMIVSDVSGRPKIYAEGNATANWGGLLDENTVSPIPLDELEVVDWPDDAQLHRQYMWPSRDGQAWPESDWATSSFGGPVTFDTSTAKGRMQTSAAGVIGRATTTATFTNVRVRGRLEPLNFDIAARNGSPSILLVSADGPASVYGLELRPGEHGWRLFHLQGDARTDGPLVSYSYRGGGTSIWFELESSASGLRAKVWNGNDPEPTRYRQTMESAARPDEPVSIALQFTTNDVSGYAIRWADLVVVTGG